MVFQCNDRLVDYQAIKNTWVRFPYSTGSGIMSQELHNCFSNLLQVIDSLGLKVLTLKNRDPVDLYFRVNRSGTISQELYNRL